MTRILMVKSPSLRAFAGNAAPISRLATLSDVTVVTRDLTLYSSHEWRPPSLGTFAAAMSRCEEEPK